MITGSELIEKLYSEEYNEGEERLYSTGDEELDDLLEKAFSEGYEYFLEQREFGRRESVRSGRNTARGSVKPGTELSVDLAKVADEIPEAKTVGAREKLSKRLSDWANKHKKPLIGTGIGLATIGTGAYLYNKNKKKEE